MRFTTSRPGPLVLAALALAACDDGTDPGSRPFEITVTAETEWDSFGSEGRENPVVTCDVFVTATADGRSRDEATWQDGVFRIYAGADRTEPIDSLPIGVTDVQQIMRAETIEGGEEQQGGFRFTSGLPMGIVAELRYEIDGDVRATTFAFDCGPHVAAGGSYPLPQLGPLVVGPELLEPGGRLDVSYEVESTIGVWSTTFILSGAVNDTVYWTEFMLTDVSGTVSFDIPADAPLGATIDIRVIATDVALQQVSRTVSAGPLMDATAPTGELTIGDSCGYNGCQFGAGDSIAFTFTGSDNAAMGWLVYEIGDPVLVRDSAVIADQHVFMGTNRVAVRPEWMGTQRVRAWVRDAAGNTTAPLVDTHVHVYPVVDAATTTAALPSGFALGAAAADFDAGRLYLADGSQPRLIVLDVPGLAVVQTVTLPGAASGVALSPDGSRLIVSIPSEHAIAAYDPANLDAEPELVAIDAVASAEDMGLTEVAVGADGLWLAAFESSWDFEYTERVIAVDPATGEQSVVLGPTEIGGLHASAAGEVFVTVEGDFGDEGDTTCMRRFRFDVRAFDGCVMTPGFFADLRPEPDHDGDRWATGFGLFDAGWQRIGDALSFMGAHPPGVPAADGSSLLVFHEDRLYRVDPATRLIGMRAAAAYGEASELFVSEDGRTLIRLAAGPTRKILVVVLP